MLFAQALQQFETINAWQANIDHNQIERTFAEFLQCGFTAVNSFWIMTVLGQCCGNLPRYGEFIFND
jgi:hypothetical protein